MEIKRKKYDAIKAHLNKKEFTILIGARQIGKSTLLRQLQQELINEGYSPVLLNLERKDILETLDKNPENIFKYIPNNSTERIIVLIDEVQYLQDPTNFLKLLYDEYVTQIKLVVTGSSAFYIDRQFKDSLVGRKRIFEMTTLDFEEFLLFKNNDILHQELVAIKTQNIKKSVLESQLWIELEEFLTYGGYPAVVLAESIDEKIERLQEIRDSFVKRDILEAGVTDESKFFRLMMLLASQTGNLLNVNELANTLRLSNSMVEEYLYILQKCFHVQLIRPFYQNLRKELTKMPKIYFNDLGLRNILINYFAPLDLRIDKGALLENYVYLHLAQTYSKEQIKFWRTADGNEVDFIIDESLIGGKAIEVKFNPTETNVKKYKKFIETYPNFPLEFYCWRSKEMLLQ